jgi:hypothetical protein
VLVLQAGLGLKKYSINIRSCQILETNAKSGANAGKLQAWYPVDIISGVLYLETVELVRFQLRT